jgi:hypothetical protein
MQILTPRGETAYLYLFNPQDAMEEGKDPLYSATFIWDEGNPRLKKLEDAIVEVAAKFFFASEYKDAGTRAKALAKAKGMLDKGQYRSPLRPGSDKEDAKDADLYVGKKFLKTSTPDKPQVVDKDLETVMHQLDVYSGCIGRADVWLFGYDKKGNRGVSARLNSFQKLDDGERKSGRRPATEAFAEEDGDGGDDPLMK